MGISRLSYVYCDECDGYPAQPGEDATEARGIARREGYTRVAGRDICGRCSGAIDASGWPITASATLVPEADKSQPQT